MANDVRFAAERHDAILALAEQDGRVEVAALARRFGVTTETVRRDLSHLERQGVLRRLHGGAVLAGDGHTVPDLEQRRTERAAEKAAIARAAINYLPDSGAVLLDSGTTTGAMAEIFPEDRQLTVVTNSLPNACALARHSGLEVHAVGGRVRPTTLATVAQAAHDFLVGVFVDVAFIAAYGISVERGLSTPDHTEAAVKRAMIRSAAKIIVVADHTKVGLNHFAQFGDLSQVDVLITDDQADPAQLNELDAHGLVVEVVPSTDATLQSLAKKRS